MRRLMFAIASWTGWSRESLEALDSEELQQWAEQIPEDQPPPRAPL
ncbi:hypothetical protein [Microbulbifer sp. PSTR4-B]